MVFERSKTIENSLKTRVVGASSQWKVVHTQEIIPKDADIKQEEKMINISNSSGRKISRIEPKKRKIVHNVSIWIRE